MNDQNNRHSESKVQALKPTSLKLSDDTNLSSNSHACVTLSMELPTPNMLSLLRSTNATEGQNWYIQAVDQLRKAQATNELPRLLDSPTLTQQSQGLTESLSAVNFLVLLPPSGAELTPGAFYSLAAEASTSTQSLIKAVSTSAATAAAAAASSSPNSTSSSGASSQASTHSAGEELGEATIRATQASSAASSLTHRLDCQPSAASQDHQLRLRQDRKRERNREAAKKCRERKINLIKSLQNEVDELEDENRNLQVKLARTQAEVEYLKDFVHSHIESSCPILSQT